MTISKALLGVAGAGALTAGILTGPVPAEAATGACDEGTLGYRISSPASYQETGGKTVVIGLTAPARTVTFTAADGSGCTFEVGDHWSVDSAYFQAQGTYDGTAASLTDSVHVDVPDSDGEVGYHQVVVRLDDVTGNDNDIVDTTILYLKRRTEWRNFNVYYESPTPACGVITGTTLHGKGQLVRASWTRNAYGPYSDRHVRLLSSPGHTAGHDLEGTVDTDVTNSNGWAYFGFKPRYDATYFAHYGGNSYAGHSDSSRDYVNCAS